MDVDSGVMAVVAVVAVVGMGMNAVVIAAVIITAVVAVAVIDGCGCGSGYGSGSGCGCRWGGGMGVGVWLYCRGPPSLLIPFAVTGCHCSFALFLIATITIAMCGHMNKFTVVTIVKLGVNDSKSGRQSHRVWFVITQ